jgi:integrase
MRVRVKAFEELRPDVTKVASSGARRGGVTSFVVPERDRDGPVNPMLVTGARRSEVAGMMWREIDFDAKLWTLPAARAKNATEYQIPLSDSAVDILQALPRIAGSDIVFTLSGSIPIRGFHNIKTRLDDLPALDPA